MDRVLPSSAPASYLDRLSDSSSKLNRVHRTPIKATSASHRRSVETHHAIDAHLKEELRDAIEYDVPLQKFIDGVLLPSNGIRREYLAALVGKMRQMLLKKSTPPTSPPVSRDFVSGNWLVNNVLPDGYSENVFLPYFCELFQGLAVLAAYLSADLVAAGLEPIAQPDRVFLENRVRYLEAASDGPQARRKLDWYVCNRSAAGLRWDAVQMYAEMKKSNNETAALWKFDHQMAGYAREIFHAQPDRTHVHGMCVQNATIWLYRWDRLGALVSEPFDFQHKWEVMLQVVLSYVYMDSVDMGQNQDYHQSPDYQSISPTVPSTHSTPTSDSPTSPHEAVSSASDAMHLSENPPPGRYVLRIGEQDYTLNQILARQKSLVGRATACWIAQTPDGAGFVVKTAWPQTTQVSEETFYNLAKEHRVHGLMDLVATRTRPSTVRKERGGVEGTFNNSLPTAQKRKLPTIHEAPRDNNKKRRLTKSETPTMKREPTVSPQQADVAAGSPSTTHPIDRSFYALAFKNAVGLPLDQLKSPIHQLKVVRAALELHRRLYTEAGIIHSDISAYNILATQGDTRLTSYCGDSDKDRPPGFLIDFDYATTRRQQVTNARHRTGTLMFMAVSVLKDQPSSYRSDLESFFYVICYMCTHFPVEEEEAMTRKFANNVKQSWGHDNSDSYKSFSASRHQDIEAHGPLTDWVNGNLRNIIGRKKESLKDGIEFKETVLAYVTPTFMPAIPLIDALRKAVIRSEWFDAVKTRDQVKDGHKEARLKQQDWISRGEPSDEKDPLIEYNEKVISEEDEDAHVLYKEMAEQLDAFIKKWESGL